MGLSMILKEIRNLQSIKKPMKKIRTSKVRNGLLEKTQSSSYKVLQLASGTIMCGQNQLEASSDVSNVEAVIVDDSATSLSSLKAVRKKLFNRSESSVEVRKVTSCALRRTLSECTEHKQCEHVLKNDVVKEMRLSVKRLDDAIQNEMKKHVEEAPLTTKVTDATFIETNLSIKGQLSSKTNQHSCPPTSQPLSPSQTTNSPQTSTNPQLPNTPRLSMLLNKLKHMHKKKITRNIQHYQKCLLNLLQKNSPSTHKIFTATNKTAPSSSHNPGFPTSNSRTTSTPEQPHHSTIPQLTKELLFLINKRLPDAQMKAHQLVGDNNDKSDENNDNTDYSSLDDDDGDDVSDKKKLFDDKYTCYLDEVTHIRKALRELALHHSSSSLLSHSSSSSTTTMTLSSSSSFTNTTFQNCDGGGGSGGSEGKSRGRSKGVLFDKTFNKDFKKGYNDNDVCHEEGNDDDECVTRKRLIENGEMGGGDNELGGCDRLIMCHVDPIKWLISKKTFEKWLKNKGYDCVGGKKKMECDGCFNGVHGAARCRVYCFGREGRDAVVDVVKKQQQLQSHQQPTFLSDFNFYQRHSTHREKVDPLTEYFFNHFDQLKEAYKSSKQTKKKLLTNQMTERLTNKNKNPLQKNRKTKRLDDGDIDEEYEEEDEEGFITAYDDDDEYDDGAFGGGDYDYQPEKESNKALKRSYNKSHISTTSSETSSTTTKTSSTICRNRFKKNLKQQNNIQNSNNSFNPYQKHQKFHQCSYNSHLTFNHPRQSSHLHPKNQKNTKLNPHLQHHNNNTQQQHHNNNTQQQHNTSNLPVFSSHRRSRSHNFDINDVYLPCDRSSFKPSSLPSKQIDVPEWAIDSSYEDIFKNIYHTKKLHNQPHNIHKLNNNNKVNNDDLCINSFNSDNKRQKYQSKKHHCQNSQHDSSGGGGGGGSGCGCNGEDVCGGEGGCGGYGVGGLNRNMEMVDVCEEEKEEDDDEHMEVEDISDDSYTQRHLTQEIYEKKMRLPNYSYQRHNHLSVNHTKDTPHGCRDKTNAKKISRNKNFRNHTASSIATSTSVVATPTTAEALSESLDAAVSHSNKQSSPSPSTTDAPDFSGPSYDNVDQVFDHVTMAHDDDGGGDGRGDDCGGGGGRDGGSGDGLDVGGVGGGKDKI